MKPKFDRIISIATLVASLAAIVLVMRKPAPLKPSQAPATAVQQLPVKDQTPAPQVVPAQGASGVSEVPEPIGPSHVREGAGGATVSNAKAETNSREESHADAISSALTQMLGGAAGSAALSPNSSVGSGTPIIKDQQVTMDGDTVHGKFLTEIAGKDVWVTISGHMGEKDGYATFDPTEFKVGDTSIPVSVVNPALQRKLAEERERLKITTDWAQ